MANIRVGLLGLGVVGCGVLKTIRSQADKLAERLGKRVEIVKILVRDPAKERPVTVENSLLTTRFEDVLEAGADVIVEVMGGVEPAGAYVRRAIAHGCHVVTANKELLAKHGCELIRLANQHRVHLAYEASVAGGIPILAVLRQFLRTNEITCIQGVINGTTNYILTRMERHQLSYREALAEAQKLGFAEADPTADVEGYDPAYKLYILSQLVFGKAVAWQAIVRKGISQLSAAELQTARALGFRVKLLARAVNTAAGVQLSVSPTLLPPDHPLAGLEEAYNGIQVTGNIVGDLLFTGRGAGELPTASAVVEDLAYLLTQPFVPQPEWQHVEPAFREETLSGKRDTWFLYLEEAPSHRDPHRVLQGLDREGIEVVKLHAEFHKHEVLRLGLLVRAGSLERLERAADRLGTAAKIYPVLLTGQEADMAPAASDSRKELVLSE
ncbi:homoserine dehydrogenase [Brevibacillus sp. SYP-B805]|uniref:homoserine dehydrogenase n=1 Tax=Brevibacillus sp. SYP-B805 TaxID=1578199 RepID=UPI0013ECB79E|nr:homoserine dehydrogenase [Brevibacillus sp. SYP-B805]NGQ93787.1 homoserine dehydrogenase [Brevibacillus sp. SYP-B805]